MGGHQTRCLLHTVNCEGQKKKENDKIKGVHNYPWFCNGLYRRCIFFPKKVSFKLLLALIDSLGLCV